MTSTIEGGEKTSNQNKTATVGNKARKLKQAAVTEERTRNAIMTTTKESTMLGGQRGSMTKNRNELATLSLSKEKLAKLPSPRDPPTAANKIR